MLLFSSLNILYVVRRDIREVLYCIMLNSNLVTCNTFLSYLYEPEGNACSLTDSTAEEHVLALVEHAADEARDRISRYMPNSKVFMFSLCRNSLSNIQPSV